MRLLLDECVPKRLKRELSGHQVLTVREAGWAGFKNGALLRPAGGQFDVPVTVDQGRFNCTARPCDDHVMPSSPLTELLKLPAGDRAELAMALWESLSDAEREGELQLSDADRAELDRRWAEHLQNPKSAIPWADVRRKLQG
jgi:putative addiction module component (TIGR02574 family)